MATRDIYDNGFDEASGKHLLDATCPECSGHIETEAGESACTACGLVIEQCRIDPGPEWRDFTEDDGTRKRTGAPVTFTRHDRGLSTEIGYGSDARGNPLSGRKRHQVSRMRREHNRGRWRSKREQNLGHGCAEVARITADLELSRSVQEEASYLFRRAQTADLLRGRSVDGMAGACVYATCRCRGLPRRIEEVAAVTHLDERALRNRFSILNVELDIQPTLVRPSAVLPRIASATGVPSAVRGRGLELVARSEREGLANGKRPSGVAAACLYQAAQERGTGMTQSQLADAADTSTETLRKRWQELRRLLEQ